MQLCVLLLTIILSTFLASSCTASDIHEQQLSLHLSNLSLADSTTTSLSSNNENKSIKNLHTLFLLRLREDFFDACFNLDIQKFDEILEQLTTGSQENAENLQFFKNAIELVLEGGQQHTYFSGADGGENEIRWIFIEKLLKYMRQDVHKLDCTSLLTSWDNKLKLSQMIAGRPLVQSTEISIMTECESASFKDSNNDKEMFKRLLENVNDSIRRLEWSKTMIPNFGKSLNRRQSRMRMHYMPPSTPFSLILPLRTQQYHTISNSHISSFIDFLKLAESSNPVTFKVLHDLSQKHRKIWLDFCNWIIDNPARIVKVFINSQFKVATLLYESIKLSVANSIIENNSSSRINGHSLVLESLFKNLKSIAKESKDSRVIPYLLDELNQNRNYNHGANIKVWSRVLQTYLNYVALNEKSSTELYRRLSLIEGKFWTTQLFGSIFDGTVDHDPVLLSIYCHRWGLTRRLLRFHDIIKASTSNVSIIMSSRYLEFFHGLVAIPLSIYKHLIRRYNVPAFKTDLEIFDFLSEASIYQFSNREVLTRVLGRARPFVDEKSFIISPLEGSQVDAFPTSFDVSRKEDQVQTILSALEGCLTYQLDGWLVEILKLLHVLFESEGHLSDWDRHYHERKLYMNRFGIFLRFFKLRVLHIIRETSSRELNMDLDKLAQSDPLLLLDTAYQIKSQICEMSENHKVSLIIRGLEEKIDWLLHHVVPTIKDPYHTDVVYVLMQEGSDQFNFQLLESNPIYAAYLVKAFIPQYYAAN